jgi:hypothetical protein
VSLARALATALAEVSPPIQAIPVHETLNRLSELGLTAEYGDLVSEFARGGTMDRHRLQRIGSALAVRYLLQPGLAEVTHTLADKFEFAGWKILRTRITGLKLWLRLWDAESGRVLWESSGDAVMATHLLREDASVPFGELAHHVWLRMIQHDLLGGETKSRWFFSE